MQQQQESLATTAASTELAFAFVQQISADLRKDRDLQLPGFPDVVVKLHRALSDENGSLREVSRLINSEPALAARLLQLANSAAFRQKAEPVGELRSAVTMLGLNIVRATATNFALQQMKQQAWLQPLLPELENIWRNSNAVAAVAYTIARQLEAMPADKAMVAGLFHQLGRLYLLTYAHRDGSEILRDPAWEFIVADWHATITRAILESWGLPEDVTYATESQDAVLEGQTGNLDRLSLLLAASKYYVCHSGDEADKPEHGPLSAVIFSRKSFATLIAENLDEIELLRRTIS